MQAQHLLSRRSPRDARRVALARRALSAEPELQRRGRFPCINCFGKKNMVQEDLESIEHAHSNPSGHSRHHYHQQQQQEPPPSPQHSPPVSRQSSAHSEHGSYHSAHSFKHSQHGHKHSPAGSPATSRHDTLSGPFSQAEPGDAFGKAGPGHETFKAQGPSHSLMLKDAFGGQRQKSKVGIPLRLDEEGGLQSQEGKAPIKGTKGASGGPQADAFGGTRSQEA